MSELLDAVKGSPLLLAFLVVGGFLVYAVERLGGLDGPVSRALRAWQDRELRALRREAMVRAEQRRIEAEERGDRERDLLAQLAQARRERDAALAQLAQHPPRPRHSGPDEGPPTNPLRRESARARPPGR